MRLFDPNPELRWLFCLTHPDDEISICAWIRRLARQGNAVYLSWTHSTPVREREARAAALLLGVPESNLFFHNATDGSVCMEIGDLIPKFQKMMQIAQPDRVCCGAFEQGHLDHDATNFILSRTAECPVLEIPFYHTYVTRLQTLNRFSDGRGQEILHLEPDEQGFKRLIARQYPSQNIWQVVFWYEVSQNARFRRMQLAKSERMRLQYHFDYLKPNHPRKIADKVTVSKSWRRWRKAMRNVKVGRSGSASPMEGRES